MGSRIALAALALAVLVAGGLFFVLSEDDGSSERGRSGSAVAAANQPGDEGPARPAADLAGVESSDRGDDPSRTEIAPITETVAPVAMEEDDEPAEDAPSISGRVFDAMGQPLPGALVFASNMAGAPIDYEGEPGMSWYKRSRATTDEDGRFELRGPRPGTLHLVVRSPGFAPYEERELPLPSDERVELEPIRMEVGAVLAGHVVDAGGGPVAGARLIARKTGAGMTFFMPDVRQRAVAVTAEDGSFRVDELACGPWKMQVETEDHPTGLFEGLAETPGKVVGGLLFQLDRGTTISGVVTDVPEDERDELEVVARKEGQDGFFDFGGGEGRECDVAEDGTFTVRGVDADEDYLVQARLRRVAGMMPFGRSRSQRVRAMAGDRGIEVPYQPEAAITFQVMDSNSGKPVTEYSVGAGTMWPEPLRGADGKPLREHPEGIARVGNLRPASKSERVQLDISATGYVKYHRDDISVLPGDILDLGQIWLDPVPVVRVMVTDKNTGEPVEGAMVQLTKERHGGGTIISHSIEIGDASEDIIMGDHGSHARTDENGLAEITSLEGETVTIKVTSKEHAAFQLDNVFLPVGEVVERAVELTPGGSVLVHVSDPDGNPVAGVRVSHQSPAELSSGSRTMMWGGSSKRNVTNKAGEVVFENLEAGVHAFKLAEDRGPMGFLSGAGEAVISIDGAAMEQDPDWQEVDVLEAEQSEVHLQSEPKGSLAGVITESGKPLAGATVSLSERSEGGGPMGMRGIRMLGMGGGGGLEAKTNGKGEYLIEGVKFGDYDLSVTHPTRRMADEFELGVDGENSFDADLSVSILEGRVTSAEGEPLEGIRVTADYASEGGGPQTMFRSMAFVVDSGDGGGAVSMDSGSGLGDVVYTDSDGRYSLRGVAHGVKLEVKGSGDQVQPGASEPVQVERDQVRRNVDFTLKAGGSIEVEALLADGAPARFVMVNATYEGEDSEGVSPKFGFVQSGSTSLTGMKPGPWKVTASKAGPGAGGGGQEELVEVLARETVPITFRMD